jgi:hypothetical protein
MGKFDLEYAAICSPFQVVLCPRRTIKAKGIKMHRAHKPLGHLYPYHNPHTRIYIMAMVEYSCPAYDTVLAIS